MVWIVSVALAIVAAGCWWQVRQLAQAFRDADEWQREETW